MSKRIVTRNEAIKELSKLSSEFVIVDNPSYIHPKFEIFPLAGKNKTPLNKVVATVMDMDGTTTTTEVLCIHSLEYMVRCISGRMSTTNWSGLDNVKDYPNIIGNSTTKHVEYLISTYQNKIVKFEAQKAFIEAAIWTLIYGKDQGRKSEVTNNLVSLGVSELLSDKSLIKFQSIKITKNTFNDLVKYAIKKYAAIVALNRPDDFVRVGIDIYYKHYHELLQRLLMGESQKIISELHLEKGKHLIEPMPAVGIYLAIVKGLLGEDAAIFSDYLVRIITKNNSKMKLDAEKLSEHLKMLGIHFLKNPLKIAVVTSSILYEADIVLREVFKAIQDEIKTWQLPSQRKRKLIKVFSDYKSFYDSVITANDSSEIRLKPHRDLYSMALYKLSIDKKDFNKVIGFEDSESGLIAMRAAGIGNCVAVPFAQTSGHNFKAASLIANNGVADILVKF
jgi:beta-phosphoglucomutase-like phosphatase (HAD superfamily)